MYRRIGFLLILISLPCTVFAVQPILRLDTGGHTAIVWDLIVTPDSKKIITSSDDKTIRVWDIVRGVEERKILGEITPNSGEVYAVAMSPDGRWLFSGGAFNNPMDVVIRVYDYKGGRLVRTVKAHDNVINALSVSSDGRYLVSASSDSTVKVWDIKQDFQPVITFTGHKRDVYDIKIFKDAGDYRIVSVSSDSSVRLWSIETKDQIKGYENTSDLRHLAVSERFIAVSGTRERVIKIFDKSLNLYKEIKTETIPAGLSFSPDGSLLIAGIGDQPAVCGIYDVKSDFKKINGFKGLDNTAIAVGFLDNDTAVLAGGANYDIYVWDVRSGAVKSHMVGKGRRIWTLGLKGMEAAFGNSWTADTHTATGRLERSIDLLNRRVAPLETSEGYKRMVLIYKGLTLAHTSDEGMAARDAVLSVMRGEDEITAITRDQSDGERHNVYTFTPDGRVISGGSGGYLTAYDMEGTPIASFIGHTGDIWALAIDKNILISAGDDQTIKLWNLLRLREGVETIYPIVNVFVSNDNEWVIWTDEGIYDASPNGAKYIGFHIDRGPDRDAAFIPASSLIALKRPDLIKAKLQGKDIWNDIRKINIYEVIKKLE